MYLIIDLEMSGSESDYHDILQIGCVLADKNWKTMWEFESLVYPENPDSFSADSEKIHGLSLSDLQDAPLIEDVLENLETGLRKALHRQPQDSLRDLVICGQSVMNDINFLRQNYTEVHMNWPFSYKMFDLMSVTMLFERIWQNTGKPCPKSLSLKSVAAHFGIHREEEHHNALEDAKLTQACFKKYDELSKSLSWTTS
ncbi:MAG: 3'-5' exonuclease [Bacteroidia bacterium]|nr:3'-5' exonuclease [Bacteroidia bacterium]